MNIPIQNPSSPPLPDDVAPALSRRQLLHALGGLALTASAVGAGCGAANEEGTSAGAGASALDSKRVLEPDAAHNYRVGTRWATGGTSALAPAQEYPDPFVYAVVTGCIPTCSMMLGPCHDELAPEREDISEGLPGLPTRFGLRIVDDFCRPVVGANIDVWHTSAAGIYSSETSDTPSYCTDGTPESLGARYFRGRLNTDAKGIVWFKTCMPGWYEGRAVHIHVRVRRNGHGGEEYLTTQLAFASGLTEDVFQSHPDYVTRGAPDTTVETDFIFDPTQAQLYTVDAQRMADGTLMIWKTIAIRSSLIVPVCAIGPDLPSFPSQG